MTAPLTVRDARADDIDALLVLIHSAYRGEASRAGWTTEADLLDGNRVDAEMLTADVADPATTLLVAEEDGGGPLVACCAVVRIDADVASFGMFAVLPQRQGGGRGRRMLAEAERRAVAGGATTMEMSVIRQRDELIAWYVRRGYADTGRTKPFPYGDPRYGDPRRDDLEFAVLARRLI